MKRFVTLAIASALTLSTPVLMAAGAPAAKAAAQSKAAPSSAEQEKQLAQWLEQIRLMQQQMEKIRQTTNPQERQNIMQEHWKTMQQAMQTMNLCCGGVMMEQMHQGCCTGGMHGMGGQMPGGPMMGNRMMNPEMMQNRMDMMQMMMDQMMQHQQWMWPQK
ncbi:MAG: hypothetical protein HY846_01480 [Nitrosomonadales bacterium]|nr:hypothetical protein [Nitrosomonadales bacterium]